MREKKFKELVLRLNGEFLSLALAQVSSLRARAQIRLPKDFFSSEFLSTQDKRGESNESKKVSILAQ